MYEKIKIWKPPLAQYITPRVLYFFGLDLTPKAKPSLTNELQGPKLTLLLRRQYWRLTKTFRSPNSFFHAKRSFDSEKRSSRPFFAYNIPKATNNQRRREDLEKPLTISVPCELTNVLTVMVVPIKASVFLFIPFCVARYFDSIRTNKSCK